MVDHLIANDSCSNISRGIDIDPIVPSEEAFDNSSLDEIDEEGDVLEYLTESDESSDSERKDFENDDTESDDGLLELSELPRTEISLLDHQNFDQALDMLMRLKLTSM